MIRKTEIRILQKRAEVIYKHLQKAGADMDLINELIEIEIILEAECNQ